MRGRRSSCAPPPDVAWHFRYAGGRQSVPAGAYTAYVATPRT